MSEILELLLEFVLNVLGFLLEVMADIWLGDLTWPRTSAGRVFGCTVLVLLAGLIWLELR